MGNLIYRSALTVLIIVLAALFFLPNVLEQRLAVAFNESYWTSENRKVPVDPERIQDFRVDRENGLLLYFPGSECEPAAGNGLDQEHRCVLKSRFVTSARVNELVQAHPELIDETRTGLLAHPIEEFFSFFTEKESKNLQVKLGLDLQGGMRANFRADFETYLNRLREKYEPILEKNRIKLTDPTVEESEKQGIRQEIQNIEEQLSLTEPRKQQLLMESKNIIDKRLAAQNLTEPEVRVQPASYSIAVDMPGVANSSDVLSKIKDTVTVEYRIVNDELSDRINMEYAAELDQIKEVYRSDRVDIREANQILDSVQKRANLKAEEGRIFLYWRKGRRQGTESLPRDFLVLGPSVLDGSDMTHATEAVNPDSGYYRISFILSATGAEKFADVTTENKGKRLAILWGDRVVSAPQIQEPIVGGQGVINGDFDREEAISVSNVIREGALPMSLEIISVSYVGPGLGQESIIAGVISILLGFLMVIIFMIVYYRLSGVVAVLALLLNLLLMAAILSLLEFTLTLPGFAGVILTVGMAVDANVIIFEKMREELRAGKALSVSIENGFRSSFWTILDANITTLIAAIILYYNGDGPIKGFAITLFFGLVSSIFTSLFVSRLVFDWLIKVSNINLLRPFLGLHKRSI